MPERVRVLAPGGEQVVTWAGGKAELQLTGPAVVLAKGTWLAERAAAPGQSEIQS
jgi:diaminopimelate epimerase